MARSDRHNRNLAKVKSMLDGTFERDKIQVGMHTGDIHGNREVGERYFDHDGKEWEKTEWGRKTVDKLPSVGLGDNCKSCKSLIIKPWDKDTFKADNRCYHCQLNYELDLQFDSPIRWWAYRRLKDLKNMEDIQKEMEQWVDAITEERKQNPFDETLANALSNANIEMTINKNKS